ncbi:phage gp16-like protein [Rhodopseudomonas rhenobacensis]|uniref:Phage gp16-like protein n=1 Tax=Rhodopseudomonas rhenobacensis TaxID=87461 RepID=A0A7W7Z2N8_9BRAD|nr:regulatory protein GemA [Rhodopseudomonas rhenobacensis]MBB5046768.1 phage gp16-like protein [Rhodopseudomonas rhenobacensis]
MTRFAVAKVSAPQIAMIHLLAKQAGIDDDCRRDVMEAVCGKRSARDLTAIEAVNVIDRLKGASKSADIDGPYGKKIRALWISAWNLGVVHNRTDAAMLAFVERQTGIERTRWLRAAKDARKAVEALKQWLAREAGVKWPAGDDPIAVRRAVIEAQQRLLGLPVMPATELLPDDAVYLDQKISLLGRQLRKALAKPARY